MISWSSWFQQSGYLVAGMEFVEAGAAEIYDKTGFFGFFPAEEMVI